MFVAVDREYGYPGEYPIRRCLDCQLSYNAVVPSAQELKRAYPARYGAHGTVPSTRYAVLSRVLSLFSAGGGPSYFNVPILRPGASASRLLDLGSGSGWSAALYAEAGWMVVGLDLYRAALTSTASRGIPSIMADAARPPFRDRCFAAVIANNVLEHLYSPRDALREFYRVLQPGGLLVVALPNFDALDRMAFGSAWYGQLHVPRHLVHFNPHSLHVAIETAGFVEVEVRKTPYPTFGGSLLQRIGVDYSDIRSRRLLWTLASAMYPIDLLSLLGGLSSAMVAYAKRPATP